MRKLIGFLAIAVIGYLGYWAIGHYFTPKSQTRAFSELHTKLQKAMVMMGETAPANQDLRIQQPKKVTQPISKSHLKKVSTFSVKKSQTLRIMEATFNALVAERHIFRYEVSEMINIIKKSKPAKSLDVKLIYAKNWSSYIKNNISKFKMSASNKNRVKNMTMVMQDYLQQVTKPLQMRTPALVETKMMKKVVTSKNPTPQPSKSFENSLMKKSLADSLVALNQWKQEQAETKGRVEQASRAWIAAVALFSLIALWMSSEVSSNNSVADKSKEQIDELNPTAVLDIEQAPQSLVNQEPLAAQTELEEIDRYFFDEISNNLSPLCQAKGVLVNTTSVENAPELIERYKLVNIADEIEGFTKTIIRSLSKDGTKTLSIDIVETSTRLKMIARVESDQRLEVNMTRIASGFRELEERLSCRKGVFNIEQNVASHCMDFIMQVVGETKSESVNAKNTGEDQAIRV